MEDQRYHIASTFLFVCYIGSALSDGRRDVSCSSSPFVTSRSRSSLLEKEATPPGDACKVDGDKLSGLVCLPETDVLTAPWKSNSCMLPQEKPVDSNESNKSKVASHSKIAIKKQTNGKKLKGSKSQRKKNKKKKMAKKKKIK